MKKILVSTVRLLAIALSCSTFVERAQAAERPNIIFILADDQSWWDFSFMYRNDVEGPALNAPTPQDHTIYQVAQTPAIDRLADEGLAFTHGYTVPLCRPSLQAMITGMFPHQNKISGNDMVGKVDDTAADEQVLMTQSIARTLVKRLGYRAFQTGKWWGGHHSLGGFTEGDTQDSIDSGTNPPQYTGSRPGGYVTRGRHGDWGLMAGRVDYINDIQSPEHWDEVNQERINYANTIVTLTDFIDDCVANDDPFFAWYAPFLPHTPHDPPPALLNKYDDLIDEPDESGNYHAKYYANIERLDGGIEAILDHLDAAGIADNTMIILISDNGWITKDNASAYAPRSKRSHYEGGVRTPILVHWPNMIKAGGALEPQIVTQPVSVIDMVTTALAAVDLQPTPEQRGVNLMDLAAVDARDAIYCDVYAHDMASLEEPAQTLQATFIRKDGWKLLLYPNGSKELFHLYDASTGDPVDPFETNELSGSEPTRTADLLAQLNAWYNEPKDMDWGVQAAQTEGTDSADIPADLGQTFAVETSSYLAGIKVPFQQVDTNQTMTLELRELDGSQAPLGMLLSQVTVVPEPVFTNGLRWCLFPFDSPIPVSAGQHLGFLLKTSSQPNGGYVIPYNSAGGYGDGKMYYTGLLEGNTWDAADYDLPFQALHGNYADSVVETEIRILDNQVHASVDMGIKGQPVRVQTSSNLTNEWVDVGDDDNLDGLVAVSETLQSQKFYRFALSLTGAEFIIPIPDTTPPAVTSMVPSNGTTNVSPSSVLSLTFDEEVKAGTGNITIHLASNNSVVQTIDVTSGNVSFAGDTITINPPSSFALATDYYVNIPAGAVADLSDNAWAGISDSASWVFTTATQLAGTSPVHHWTFDEGSGTTTADTAGSENGSINGATWATGTGDRASYLSFDGSNDSVDPSLFLPQWSASNAETWTLWVNDAGGNNNDIILGNRLDGATTAGGRLFAKMIIGATSGRFVYNDGTAYAGEFSGLTPGYSGNFPDGTWVHLAIVRDGADFTFYVDGNLVNSTAVTIPSGDMPTAAMPFFVGGEPGASATEHFKGGLDDVVIYDAALSPSEVVSVMNGTYEF